MKILIVHEVNYLSKIIYEFQILPEIFSILGHDVTIIDYDDTWSAPTNSGLIAHRQVHESVHRAYSHAAVRVIRPAMVRLPLISRISGALASGQEVFRFLKNQKPDVVLLYGVPTVGLQVIQAAKRFGRPVVFRSIDVSHQLVPSRVLVPCTRLFEKYVYRRACFNVALTPHLRDYIRSYGVPEERIRLLPSGVDTDMFLLGPGNREALRQWGITQGDQVILFMGTIYRFSGLDRVIQDFPALLRLQPKAKLLILGIGEDEQRLRQMTLERGVASQVIFAGLQPYSRLPELVRCADVCINPFELNEITEKILPTKLFQYLACGKPVVATKLAGTLPFLAGEEHGVVYTTIDEFIPVLDAVLKNESWRRELGEKGAAAANQYDWKRIAETMLSWLQEVA